MQPETKERARNNTAGEVVPLEKARLPYSTHLEEEFGVDAAKWRVLTEVVFPSAKTAQSVALALQYCRARNLDVFKRPVHIVPMYSSVEQKMVDTIWPGISEIRTTAMRTGDYAGADACEFGPEITHVFEGIEKDNNGNRNSISREVAFPAWAQVTVYRFVKGQRVPVPGPRVYWLETYARQSRWSEIPNSMWLGRPIGQIEKCAEAAALRRAFPEEIGSDYAAEEMAGQSLDGARDITPVEPVPTIGDRLGNGAAAARDGFDSDRAKEAARKLEEEPALEPEQQAEASAVEDAEIITDEPEAKAEPEGQFKPVEGLTDDDRELLQKYNKHLFSVRKEEGTKFLGKAHLIWKADKFKGLEENSPVLVAAEQIYNGHKMRVQGDLSANDVTDGVMGILGMGEVS